MSVVPFSRTVLRPVPFIWWQADMAARLNLTGFSVTAEKHALPFTPQFTITDAATGEFQLAAPTPQQAERLKSGRSYGLHVQLLNAQGQPADEFRITLAVQ